MIEQFVAGYVSFGVSFISGIIGLSVYNAVLTHRWNKKQRELVQKKIELFEDMINTSNKFIYDCRTKDIEQVNKNFLKITCYYNYDYKQLGLDEPIQRQIKATMESAINAHQSIIDKKDSKKSLEKFSKDIRQITETLKKQNVLFS